MWIAFIVKLKIIIVKVNSKYFSGAFFLASVVKNLIKKKLN